MDIRRDVTYIVSTHSRLKAAGSDGLAGILGARFQHTAA